MKKLYTLGLAALMATAAANAGEPVATVIEGGMPYQGFMPLDISSNGQYVSGSCFLWPMFTSVWQEQKTKVYLPDDGSIFEEFGGVLGGINDQGLAAGYDDLGAVIVNANTFEIQHIDLYDDEANIRSGFFNDINNDPDLQIVVGMAYTMRAVDQYRDYPQTNMRNITTQAAYWENGKGHLLPMPTVKEFNNGVDSIYFKGSQALAVSDDGKVILGVIDDRLVTRVMCYWTRNEQGTYDFHDTYKTFWSDIRDKNQKPYSVFRGDALSADGRFISLFLNPNITGTGGKYVNQIGIFDVETGEIIKIVTSDGTNNIPPNSKLDVYYHGIADNGTIAGNTYTYDGCYSPFILHFDDEQPTLFYEAFPTVDLFADMYEAENGGDNKVSAITPDGRYITGCGWMVDKRYGIGYYVGYVLDTDSSDNSKPDNGVDAIGTDPDAVPVEYYNVAGQRLSAPAIGLNIVRYSDGTSRKVIVK